MTEEPGAAAPTKCGIDIQVQLAGEWVDAECDIPAEWEVTVSLGGPFSPPAHRCYEHVGGTIDFHLCEKSTQILTVQRVGR